MLLFKQPLRGKGPIDLITVDSLIELQDSQDPFQFWIVSVLENAGGRLRLRYVGLEDTESYDQWLFYLDYRLRPVGWCQENEYRMDPPSGKGRELPPLSGAVGRDAIICLDVSLEDVLAPRCLSRLYLCTGSVLTSHTLCGEWNPRPQ